MFKVPVHAPLSDGEREVLAKLAAGWSPAQRLWVSGYLAGSAGDESSEGTVAREGGAVGGSVLVLYGTESGNSETLAAESAKQLKARGHRARVLNMAECKPEECQEAGTLLVVVSTWGEGDPPEAAESFHRAIMNGGPRLEGVRFSVCGLGDTSYEQFCEMGKQFDRRLEELGGIRLAPRVDCDVDFEETHREWMESVLAALGESAGGEGTGGGATRGAGEAPRIEYGKRHPFPARLVEKVLLNGTGSEKETWHLELDLAGSGLTYEVGDSLAVVPHNAPDVVELVLEAAGLSGTEEVQTKAGDRKTLREALVVDYDITALSRKVASGWQGFARSEALGSLLEPDRKAELRDYVEGRQIVDLLAEFPAAEISAQDLLSVLRPLPPRLYSIASSPRAHAGEVHLTVAAVRFATHGRDRKGVASTCLADLVEVGDTVPVYVTPNKRFRLPEDDTRPIVMIGPGTGVAPFRAFVEERASREAGGDSWLIFGDQRYTYDFLYQLEWQDHLKSGALTRLDVAFSRDQPEKVYVQDRIRERGGELWQWLEKGAHLYVCGDASRMAPDVHEALLEIIAEQGRLGAEGAKDYLDQLKQDGRYQRDVY